MFFPSSYLVLQNLLRDSGRRFEKIPKKLSFVSQESSGSQCVFKTRPYENRKRDVRVGITKRSTSNHKYLYFEIPIDIQTQQLA